MVDLRRDDAVLNGRVKSSYPIDGAAMFIEVPLNDDLVFVDPSGIRDFVFVRLPSFSGHPICTDLVSVGEDVHCESTAQEVHAGVPA